MPRIVIVATTICLCLATCAAHWVALKWDKSSIPGTDQYRIYRATGPNGPWSPLATVPATVLTIKDTKNPDGSKLKAGQIVCYEVASIVGGKEAPARSPVTCVTIPVPHRK